MARALTGGEHRTTLNQAGRRWTARALTASPLSLATSRSKQRSAQAFELLRRHLCPAQVGLLVVTQANVLVRTQVSSTTRVTQPPTTPTTRSGCAPPQPLSSRSADNRYQEGASGPAVAQRMHSGGVVVRVYQVSAPNPTVGTPTRSRPSQPPSRLLTTRCGAGATAATMGVTSGARWAERNAPTRMRATGW
jgi:hypothetical protein